MDAIIVLGGGIQIDGTLTQMSRSRVNTAVALFKRGIAPRIVMCGWRSFLSLSPTPRSEASLMKEYATRRGVPASCVLLEEESVDTVTNAVFVFRRYLRPKEWRSVAVVTSPFHLHRAKFIFNKVLGRGYAVSYYEAKKVHNFFDHARHLHHEAYALVILQQHWEDVIRLVTEASKVSSTSFFSIVEGSPVKGVRTALSRSGRFLFSLTSVPLFLAKCGVKVAHGASLAIYTLWPKAFRRSLRTFRLVVGGAAGVCAGILRKTLLKRCTRRMKDARTLLFADEKPLSVTD